MVDISPAVGKVSPEFQAYVDAMNRIQDAKVHSRKEADDLLQEIEPVRANPTLFPPLQFSVRERW